MNINKLKKMIKSWETLFICSLAFLLLCLLSGITYAFFSLPGTDNLEKLEMKSATEVYDINGELIAKLFEENRKTVSITNMSPYLAEAVLANEDTRFYSHYGIDPIGILRALWVDITTGNFTEGGSTITQQLAKNMFLTPERTIGRKIKEALLALIIEGKFSKQEILQAYLNQVYFGEGAYGVETAAQTYFGKHAAELDLAQSALLAGMPRGPNIFSPYVDMNAALKRRAEVLQGMVKADFISQSTADKAQKEPIVLAGKKKRQVQASYFLDYLTSQLVERYGEDRVFKGGLKVYTTLDIAQQQAAEEVLGQYQGAVLLLDPRNGHIKAMVGGRNYEESQINRVINEIRQPGSAFKPFVYTVALNQGLAQNWIIVDEPINYNGYAPQNYDKKYRGNITLKKALKHSVNIAAVKLARSIGVEQVLSQANSMGISTLVPEDNNLATALGGLTKGVSLIEMCTAFTAYANSGILSSPLAIIKVLDENNQQLEAPNIKQQQVLRPEIAYIMTDMLKAVIQGGTGSPANIGRPAAGKTGTTDNYETAWFIGYTPVLLAGIYVGNDDRTSVGISGTEVAGLWGKMMGKILAKSGPVEFPVPANVTIGVPICSQSGKLATPGCAEIEYSAFVKGTAPSLEPKPGYPREPADGGVLPGEKGKWQIPWP